jgi:hypothetical protein
MNKKNEELKQDDAVLKSVEKEEEGVLSQDALENAAGGKSIAEEIVDFIYCRNTTTM